VHAFFAASAKEGIMTNTTYNVIKPDHGGPMAYKSIDAVMEAQKDLVDIVHTLRQVVCVKG
jgi:RNA-splicing ligase RtcB